MTGPDTDDDPEWWLTANLYHTVSGGVAAVLGGVYVGVWGVDRLLALDGATATLAARYGLSELLALVLLAVAVVIVHELIHGVAYVSAGSHSARELDIGLAPYGLAIYVRPTKPLEARAYRLGLVSPGVVTGVLPAMLGIGTGDGMLLAMGMYGVLITAADIATLVELRPWDPGSMIPPPGERS